MSAQAEGRGRVLIVAGEPSGDRLGAGLARALAEAAPGITLEGMGGHEMSEAGVRILVDASGLGVTGLVEALSRMGEYRAAYRTLVDRLGAEPPGVVVPVDNPDFNLRVARRAAEAGIPVAYFVSPQVWAWRPRRVQRIARWVQRMMVLFPFEEEFYRRAKVPVTLVGHPMLDRLDSIPDRQEARLILGLPPEEPIVALLPGSRRNEVERILPVMAAAANLLQDRVAGLRFVLPVARGLDPGALERALRDGPQVIRFEDHYEDLVRAADVAAVASGTATLETALLGTPLVVVYRLHPVTYWLGRFLVRVEHVAMPNLVAGRRVVPELVQKDLTPARLARTLEDLLRDADARERMRRDLLEIRRRLGEPGAFNRAARAVLDLLDAGRASNPIHSVRHEGAEDQWMRDPPEQ